MATSGPVVKLLIVEDDLKVSALVRAFFQDEGYSVSTASNGAEALSLLHDGGLVPHVIISDIMMPEMDGFQLCKIIRDDKALAHISFLFLSALSQPDNLRWGYRVGADDYLSKPFSMEDLKRKVQNMVDIQFQRRPQAIFCSALGGVATWLSKVGSTVSESSPECMNRGQCGTEERSKSCPMRQVNPVA